MALQRGRVAGPSPPGRGPRGVPETPLFLACFAPPWQQPSQPCPLATQSLRWKLSNFSHVRKSPNCEEFEDLLSKLPFPDKKKRGKRQQHLSFPLFFPCPYESSKCLLSSCCVLLQLPGGSRWGVGSGLLFSQWRWASGSILWPETALEGWTDVPAFSRGELRSTRLNNLSKPIGLLIQGQR